MQGLLSWLRKYNNPIMIAMHDQADPDAVGSTIALIHMIRYINPRIKVSVYKPDLSRLSRNLLLHLDYELPLISEDDSHTTLILLDNPSIPSELDQVSRKIIIIDHHIKQEVNTHLLFDIRSQKVTSTSEIITQLYRIGKIPLNVESVKALLAGMIFDTRRFLYVNSELFDNISYLIRDHPKTYKEILPLFTSKRPLVERIACIKATQRMKRVEIGKFQILLSHVSSFEAAAARSLIFLGGDLAVVVGRHTDSTRISFRAESDFVKVTDISLGRDIIPLLLKEFGGSGGGHDGAAGYNNEVRMDLKAIFDFILMILTNLMTNNEKHL
jgi:nanoRNase/pAp phosphatase (c-di-AMP/oligoRNAs hydrolase)